MTDTQKALRLWGEQAQEIALLKITKPRDFLDQLRIDDKIEQLEEKFLPLCRWIEENLKGDDVKFLHLYYIRRCKWAECAALLHYSVSGLQNRLNKIIIPKIEEAKEKGEI